MIYVGGDARLRDGRQGFVLYRLRKADGSLVSRTFAEVTAPDGGTPRATDLVRLADGRLVVAGGLENGIRGVSQGALVSFQNSGTVDSGFGQNGLVLDKALTTEFRYTTAFGRIFGLTRTADGYALTAYKNAAGEIDFSWGGTGLVTGRYPSTVGKATTIAITTVSGQAKLLVGGFDGSGTGSRFFAARFRLGCVNIRACTVGVQTSGNSATFTQTNTAAQFNGILVERVLRYKRIAGRRVPVTRRVGRVPFGPQRKGRITITWDHKVNGKRLPAGTYRITMRTLRRDKVVELARPLIVKVPPPRPRAGLKRGVMMRARTVFAALSLVLAAALALAAVAAACPPPGNSAATITASFSDGCRDFAARSSKDISYVELHYVDGRVVKHERINRRHYSIATILGIPDSERMDRLIDQRPQLRVGWRVGVDDDRLRPPVAPPTGRAGDRRLPLWQTERMSLEAGSLCAEEAFLQHGTLGEG